ncbi:hypothetical protein [Nocardioides sp.]|jgi:hypothetical protein|uniref:hypothetical protein n=1 Tax=Nocardioides sp. TaxID=35761 RepID=UPI002F41AA26
MSGVITEVMPSAARPENDWAGQGAVLLDIGGDVGALVVAMPESTLGLEVEIRPLDGQHVHAHAHHHGDGHTHEHLAHVAVVARPVAEGRLPSLVFPALESGRYQLFEKGRPEAVALWVEVTGGVVTTADWPS